MRKVDSTCSLAYWIRSLLARVGEVISTPLAERMKCSTYRSMCSFSRMVPPATAITSPTAT